MADTTFEIKFSGDAAFLNALTDPKPMAKSSAPSGGSGGPSRLDSVADAAKLISGAIGGPISDITNAILTFTGQTKEIASALKTAAGFEAPAASVGKQILTKTGQDAATKTAVDAATKAGTTATTTAAAGETAAAAGGAEAAAGGAAASGILASVVNPFTAAVAVCVVAVGALALAAKKTIDVLDAETNKLADLTPAISAAKGIIEANRDLRLIRRGDDLGPQLVRFMQAQDRFDAITTEIWTNVLRTLLTAWDGARPFMEFVHDQLASINVHIAEVAAGAAYLRARFSVSGAINPEKDPEFLKAVGALVEANRTNQIAKDNKQFEDGPDSLDTQAKEMAKRLVESFGTGMRGRKIAPSR